MVACAPQVTVGCGTVCVFHVGGVLTSMAKDAVPRWELFIADRPHAEELDGNGRRQPFCQISQAEALAMPGDVILSPEVAEVLLCPLTHPPSPFSTRNSFVWHKH